MTYKLANKSATQHLFEHGFWLITLSSIWALVAWNKLQTWHRYGMTVDYFRFYTAEITSCMAATVMVYFIVWWLRRFPLHREVWKSALAGHIIGSLIFTLGHHCLYIALRVFVYFMVGETYRWQAGFLDNLIFEYQKDVAIYSGILAVVWAYTNFVSSTWFPGVEMQSDHRLIVQTGRGEAIIKVEDILWVEAARNYVVFHTADREYVTRDTLKSVMQRLSAHDFERCHRSRLVNVSNVAEIQTQKSGAYVVLLSDGTEVPLSRGYRDEFVTRFRMGTM